MENEKELANFKPDDIVKTCCYLNGNELGGAVCIADNLKLCYPRNTFVCKINDYENVDVEKLIQTRKEFFISLNNGTNKTCEGCPYLCKKPMKEINLEKIGMLNIANYTTCNLRCKYCYFTHEQLGAKLDKKSAKLLPIVKSFAAKNALSDNFMLAIAGGEPTLFQDIEETLNYMQEHYNNTCFNLQSNSTLTKNIEKIIPALCKTKKIKKNLYTSVDCGTPETYKKIRGRDCFKNLKHNLMLYAKTGAMDYIQLKYLILDDEENGMYNVGMKDIWGFAKLITQVKMNATKTVDIVIDRDLNKSHQPFSNEMLHAAAILKYVSNKIKIRYIYSPCDYISKEDIKKIDELALKYNSLFKTSKEMMYYINFDIFYRLLLIKRYIKAFFKVLKLYLQVKI